MNNNHFSQKLKLPPYLPILILSFIIAIISACILSPIYTQIISDVTIMYTVLPIIVDYVVIIFDTLYIALIFAIVSYSSYSYLKGCESRLLSISLVSGVIVLKHLLNLTVSSIMDNHIDITFDIPVTLILIAADLLAVAAVRLISLNRSRKHLARARKMQKAARYLDNVVYDEEAEVFPFSSLLNIKNPVLFPIFISMVISVALFWSQRLFADFVVLGLPSSIFEIIEIILSYASDILLGVIGYVAAYYAISYSFIKNSD